RSLAEQSGETAYLAAWRGAEIEMLATMDSSNPLRVARIPPGPYRHPHARAVGKVLLAFCSPSLRDSYLPQPKPGPRTLPTLWQAHALAEELDRVRALGYAQDHEEFLEGVCCVAAPVMQHGELLAAYGLAVPADRFNKNAEGLTHLVCRAARSV